MFEELIQELENLKYQQISVPVKADAEGYLDKECPNTECLFAFKVNQDDWKSLFRDEAVYCPMCGHNAPAKSFWTTEQIENATSQGYKYLRGKIDAALEEGANNFNLRQDQNSFFTMSFKVTGTNSQHYILPISAKKEFERKLKCDECNANFAVIGSAFFCPCCGNNSVEKTFNESLSKVEIKLNNIPIIKKAIEAVSKDEAEITCHSLIESALNDCVVAFQRFCEATFAKENPTVKLSANVFQRLEDGSRHWKEVFNQGYDDWLTVKEFARMNTLFQRRHLLSHREGLVDQKYLQRANDLTYKLGQRIVVKKSDVADLLTLIKKITSAINEKIHKVQ